jgi:hypothetical protein
VARLQVERETGVPAELTTEALLNCQIAENFLPGLIFASAAFTLSFRLAIKRRSPW